MRFSRKIFISVFATSFVIGGLLIWAAYTYFITQSEERFVARYSVFTRILADTLNRLDLSTENLMHNAAKVVAEKDAAQGLLPTSKLFELQKELNVTHIFVTDKNGKFIRSTNETPEKIPNLFSFCQDYRKLIDGTSSVEATPIIQPKPEPKPFKFLSIPSIKRDKIIEVGVRVDFIAKTLAEAVSADKNILSMSLYSPDGMPFGKFTSQKVEFGGIVKQLPSDFSDVFSSGDNFKFYTKVLSSHTRCCQCDAAGTSKNGEYYYVLEAEVSKGELAALKATTKGAFLILGFVSLILAFIFSRVLSRRLVRNIERAVTKIRGIKEHGDIKERVQLEGKDEVAFLTGEFDRLLDKIEDSQRAVIEAEKIQTRVQMAKEVAHNIKSPLVTIEMMIPMVPMAPEWIVKALRNSVKEIKTLTERLGKQGDVRANESTRMPSLDFESTEPKTFIGENAAKKEIVHLRGFVQELIEEKRIEYSSRQELVIKLEIEKNLSIDETLADPSELRAVIRCEYGRATRRGISYECETDHTIGLIGSRTRSVPSKRNRPDVSLGSVGDSVEVGRVTNSEYQSVRVVDHTGGRRAD